MHFCSILPSVPTTENGGPPRTEQSPQSDRDRTRRLRGSRAAAAATASDGSFARHPLTGAFTLSHRSSPPGARARFVTRSRCTRPCWPPRVSSSASSRSGDIGKKEGSLPRQRGDGRACPTLRSGGGECGPLYSTCRHRDSTVTPMGSACWYRSRTPEIKNSWASTIGSDGNRFIHTSRIPYHGIFRIPCPGRTQTQRGVLLVM